MRKPKEQRLEGKQVSQRPQAEKFKEEVSPPRTSEKLGREDQVRAREAGSRPGKEFLLRGEDHSAG